MIDLLLMVAVFVLSFAVGYFLILKVPQRLHSPLMSMTNAVSAVIILGALLLLAMERGAFGKWLGAAALIFAAFNVVGGFSITERMLRLFRKKEQQ